MPDLRDLYPNNQPLNEETMRLLCSSDTSAVSLPMRIALLGLMYLPSDIVIWRGMTMIAHPERPVILRWWDAAPSYADIGEAIDYAVKYPAHHWVYLARAYWFDRLSRAEIRIMTEKNRGRAKLLNAAVAAEDGRASILYYRIPENAFDDPNWHLSFYSLQSFQMRIESKRE